MPRFDTLLADIRGCTLCRAQLPLGPRPIIQAAPSARILIAGQAPGKKVHASGVPFDDASGERLRDWLGLAGTDFYNSARVAIVPMGFCYPGTGKSGDLPPLPACAIAWRQQILAQLKQIELTLVIGQYAQQYHLPSHYPTLTAAVLAWRDHWPRIITLPHPSPRNNGWLKHNPWFQQQVLPALRRRVAELIH